MSFTKDPNAVLDYVVDWATFLGASETITTVVWTLESPEDDDTLTIGEAGQAPSNTDTAATIWLLGGTLGRSYTLTCRATTSAGRIEDRSFSIYIKEN